jgi:hypothetical protein
MQEDGSVDKGKEERKVEGQGGHGNWSNYWWYGAQVHIGRARKTTISTERG